MLLYMIIYHIVITSCAVWGVLQAHKWLLLPNRLIECENIGADPSRGVQVRYRTPARYAV